MMQFRQFEQADAKAVVALDSWAMCDAGTEPTDIPGHEDITRIEDVYLDGGGAFLVGVVPSLRDVSLPTDCADAVADTCDTGQSDEPDVRALETRDGYVVAMGGLLPSEQGYEDERTVVGAAELHRMRVAPPLQGLGYGGKLLAKLESAARGRGFDKLLATTARRQRRACSFYPGNGYSRTGESAYGEYSLVHFEKQLR